MVAALWFMVMGWVMLMLIPLGLLAWGFWDTLHENTLLAVLMLWVGVALLLVVGGGLYLEAVS